ncbi:monooxygenase, FAD-binding protein [Burkholderia humptydooensis MSMB43]|uniref:Monooxygenase, FAD-binding protein n=1 Tax=Burkholderia humptydooensis MSMB43 TaxID=441157 RepID=A0ABN0FXW2_9BURK|nr:monooxygenase, FAD-binding protein [Burkholderia humptydooensis MSMB43]
MPEDVIDIGDVDSRLRDWFARVPESVVLLRTDRFVAGMRSPQGVSGCVSLLAQRLSLPMTTRATTNGATSAYAADLVGA